MRRGLLCSSLLLGALLLGQCLAEDGKPAADCDPKVDKCEDLNTCSPPPKWLPVPREVVLVLGNTGSGKSTLTKYLSNHDQEMEAAVTEGRQYIITGNGISSTIQSETTVPELMADNATGTNYVDCPGFEDTRGSCVEVSTTYYMKDIARHAKSVKVLLLTPYFAVRRGQDRADLLKMLTHASHLLRSESKLADSLALVVTKVDAFTIVKDKKDKKRKKKVPTDEVAIKNGIGKFLSEDVAPFLEKLAASADQEEREDYQRQAAIVSAVLRQDGSGNYTRIGIFRTPNSEGPLKNIPLIESGREGLLHMVHRTLRYAAVQPSDFGFSVSDRTKLFAMTRAREVSKAAVAKLSSLGANITSSRTARAYDPTDIPRTANRLHAEAREVQRVVGDLQNSTSVQDFCDRLTEDLKDTPEKALASEVVAVGHYLDVLQVVSDTPLVDGGVLSAQWMQPLEKAAEQLTAREDWNRFLVALYDRLNKHDTQRTRNPYAPLSAANLSSFEAEISRLGMSTKLRPSAANVTDLNALLALAGRAPEFECVSGGRVVVRAESVTLTEVAAGVSKHCAGMILAVEVYAINTVFVDADVRLPGVSLAVVAPRWEVIGDSRIILDGGPGDAPARRPSEARDGMRGTDGQPGRPGQPGGNFLAVGLELVGNGRVFLNGGQGGRGQDGGHGGAGQRGGGNGGDGGNGGKGGLGGHPGSGTLILEARDVQVSAMKGASGGGGRGGLKGDRRAFTGVLRRRKREIITALVIGLIAVAGVGTAIHFANRKSPTTPRPVPQFFDGKPGWDDFVTLGQLPPAAPLSAPWTDVPSRLETYFRYNLEHPYRKEEMRRFLSAVSEDETFKALTKSSI